MRSLRTSYLVSRISYLVIRIPYCSARNYTEDEPILKIDNEGMHLGLMDF
jgi:hypothetical protein